MTEIASRELRNDTAGVLRRAQSGEEIVITLKGRPVARIIAAEPARRRWLSRGELVVRLRRSQADPGLRDDVTALAGETTDDLGPVL